MFWRVHEVVGGITFDFQYSWLWNLLFYSAKVSFQVWHRKRNTILNFFFTFSSPTLATKKKPKIFHNVDKRQECVLSGWGCEKKTSKTLGISTSYRKIVNIFGNILKDTDFFSNYFIFRTKKYRLSWPKVKNLYFSE